MAQPTETSVPQGTANDVPAGSSPSFNLLPASDNVDDDCCEHCEETESECECLECDACGEKKIDENGEDWFLCGECGEKTCGDCIRIEWDDGYETRDKCQDCVNRVEEKIDEYYEACVKNWEHDDGTDDWVKEFHGMSKWKELRDIYENQLPYKVRNGDRLKKIEVNTLTDLLRARFPLKKD